MRTRPSFDSQLHARAQLAKHRADSGSPFVDDDDALLEFYGFYNGVDTPAGDVPTTPDGHGEAPVGEVVPITPESHGDAPAGGAMLTSPDGNCDASADDGIPTTPESDGDGDIDTRTPARDVFLSPAANVHGDHTGQSFMFWRTGLWRRWHLCRVYLVWYPALCRLTLWERLPGRSTSAFIASSSS